MEFRQNLSFCDYDFVVGFFVEHSMPYIIPAMFKAMASFVSGFSVCKACGSMFYPNSQLVNDYCGDESNLSGMASRNPHVKYVIFSDDLVKALSRGKFTSIPGLLNSMPSLAQGKVSVLQGSWEPEFRCDVCNSCDVIVSLASDIRPDLFVYKAMATSTRAISQSPSSGEWFNLAPDMVIKNSN